MYVKFAPCLIFGYIYLRSLRNESLCRDKDSSRGVGKTFFVFVCLYSSLFWWNFLLSMISLFAATVYYATFSSLVQWWCDDRKFLVSFSLEKKSFKYSFLELRIEKHCRFFRLPPLCFYRAIFRKFAFQAKEIETQTKLGPRLGSDSLKFMVGLRFLENSLENL